MSASKHGKRMPLVSVIIPCHNAQETLPETIRGVSDQDYRCTETILVDDASQDGTTGIISRAVAKRRYGMKGLFLKHSRSAGGARNAGLAVARGKFVAFLDADAVPGSDWLSRLIDLLIKQPELAGAGGAVVNATRGYLGWTDYCLCFSPFTPSSFRRDVDNLPTIGVVYRQSAIKGLRFPERHYAEDPIFNLQVRQRGGRLRFEPTVKVDHRPPIKGVNALLQRQFKMRDGFLYSRRHYSFADRWLLQAPWLFFLFPRTLLITCRLMFTRYFFIYLAVLPLVLFVEALCTARMFQLLWRGER